MSKLVKTVSLFAVTAVCATSFARTAVRPRPVEGVKPGEGIVVKPTNPAVRGDLSLDGAPAATTAAKGTSKAQNACEPAAYAAALAKRTGGKFNEAQAEVALKKLVIAGCKAGEQGLINFESDNAVLVAVATGFKMETMGLSGPEALAQAKTEYLGVQTTAKDEVENFNKLLAGNQSSCQVFRN
ncbi:MAG: hypothetical protein AB7F86_05955 [Bdellovibrionales bacterium]